MFLFLWVPCGIPLILLKRDFYYFLVSSKTVMYVSGTTMADKYNWQIYQNSYLKFHSNN